MSWANICIEGFCMSEDNIYPCGQKYPTIKCLGKKSFCPFFGYGESSERQVAEFAPFYLILWDRLKLWKEEIKNKLEWWLWGQLWFNQKKTENWLKNIPIAKNTVFDKHMEKCSLEFKEWFNE